MNFERFILVAMLAFSMIGRSETSNSFGIYLTAERVDSCITAYYKGNLSRIGLSESPLICATDIVSYDFAEHSMRLRPEALAKIPRPHFEGTPFVVVANGERIYLGTFTTISSSIAVPVPSIVVDRRMLVTNQPSDTLVIERAYPSAGIATGADPRPDKRIRDVLRKLRKLKNAEPDSAANGSQPVRSETNTTSSAAGSRR